MGHVISMKGRQLSKTAVWVAQAIEQEAHGGTEPVRLIVTDDARKAVVQRQLQCMIGMRPTRIEVLTYAEVMQAKMAAKLAAQEQETPKP